jgi:betaine/carnitine transporter, BCCT family
MTDKENNDVIAPEGKVNPIDTDYQVGQDNIALKIGPFGLDIHNRVFMISGLAIVAFVFLTLAFQNQVGPLFGDLRNWLTSNLDWFFLASGNIFVLVCVFLIFSPLGRVRIGGTEAKPDFSYLGWFSMLFAAGMGIGLMFYGVSEPLSHFGSAMGGTASKTACAPTGHRWGPPPVMRRPPGGSAWRPPSTTGRCTPGPSMRCWRWGWPSSPSTRGCR